MLGSRSLGAFTVVLVACVAAAAAMVNAPGARASTPPPTPFGELQSGSLSSSSTWGLINQTPDELLAEIEARGGISTADKRGMLARFFRGGQAARLFPTAMSFGSKVVLPLGVAWTGYELYRWWSGREDAEVIDLWLDHNALGADALYNLSSITDCDNVAIQCTWDSPAHADELVRWEQWPNADRCQGLGAGCWYLVLQPSSYPQSYTYGAGANPNDGNPDWDDCQTYMGYGCVASALWAQGLRLAVTRTEENLHGRQLGPYTMTRINVSDGCFGTHASVQCYRVFLPPNALDGAITLRPGEANGSPADDFTYNVPSPYTDTGTAGTATDRENFADVYDDVCGRAFVNWWVSPEIYAWPDNCFADPPASEPEPTGFYLPEPEINETYTAYISRLEDLGYIGTATEVGLSEAAGDPSRGPSSPVTVTVGSTVYQAGQWPATAPVVAFDAAITVHRNPSTYAPAPAGVPDAGSAGGCDPWLESSVDLSPITGVDLSDEFPFALFVWAGNFLGELSTEPDAPAWSFTMPELAGNAIPSFDIDLEWFDDYMSIIRTLIAWVLWIGAVWYFATALLGLRAGDPADAADEAFD